MKNTTTHALPYAQRLGASRDRLALLHLRCWWVVVTPDGVEKAEPCNLRAGRSRLGSSFQLGNWTLPLETSAGAGRQSEEFGFCTALCGIGRTSNIVWCRPEHELSSPHGALAVITYRGFGQLNFPKNQTVSNTEWGWVENDQHRERSRVVSLAVVPKHGTLLFEEQLQRGTHDYELFFDGMRFSLLGREWHQAAA